MLHSVFSGLQFLLWFQIFLISVRAGSSHIMSSTHSVIDLSTSSRALKHLFTKIRDETTPALEFRKYSKRLMHIICEEGIGCLDPKPLVVKAPTQQHFHGEQVDTDNIVAVSIIRAGDSLLDVFLDIMPEAAVGKILIQRDEETALPKLFYVKVPKLESKKIVLCDPMLATGGSAICAVKELVARGADPSNIFFFNVVACPEGLEAMRNAFPQVRVITGAIDEKLDSKSYILPGLGDYGDRFYGTK